VDAEAGVGGGSGVHLVAAGDVKALQREDWKEA